VFFQSDTYAAVSFSGAASGVASGVASVLTSGVASSATGVATTVSSATTFVVSSDINILCLATKLRAL